MDFKNKISGFTLAEVLVTLVVIGIVASMTIPGLLKSYEDTASKVAWKRAYSDIAQVVNKLIAKEALPASSNTNFLDAFEKEISYIKKCDGATEQVCFHKPNEFYNYPGYSIATTFGRSYSLKNGQLIGFRYALILPAPDPNPAFPNGLYIIYVDVNGFKGPNTLGRDIFAAYARADRLEPVSVTKPGAYLCNKITNDSSNGIGCSDKVLKGEDY